MSSRTDAINEIYEAVADEKTANNVMIVWKIGNEWKMAIEVDDLVGGMGILELIQQSFMREIHVAQNATQPIPN